MNFTSNAYQTPLLVGALFLSHSETLSVFRSLTYDACVVEGGGRNFSLPVAIVFCYVLSDQFVSRIREMTQKVISTIGEHGKTQTVVS